MFGTPFAVFPQQIEHFIGLQGALKGIHVVMTPLCNATDEIPELSGVFFSP
jgi:hypothetical protein